MRQFLLTSVASCLLSTSSFAQTAVTGNPTDEISAVEAFQRICYRQVPALQGIRNMAAQLGWRILNNDDLEPFAEGYQVSKLEGWDVQLGERFFRLGLVQGPVSPEMQKTFPDLADGVTTSCTLVLDDHEPTAKVAAEMQALAGKAPTSKDVDADFFLTTSWAGGNQDVKVFLVNKANKVGQGGVLNVTLITKEAAKE